MLGVRCVVTLGYSFRYVPRPVGQKVGLREWPEETMAKYEVSID